MCLICFSEFFQLDDARLVAYSPGHDLFRMFPVIRLDDGPAAMRAVVATPFEVMQVTRGVDFLDDCIAIASSMWRFNKITIHITSLVMPLILSNYIPFVIWNSRGLFN